MPRKSSLLLLETLNFKVLLNLEVAWVLPFFGEEAYLKKNTPDCILGICIGHLSDSIALGSSNLDSSGYFTALDESELSKLCAKSFSRKKCICNNKVIIDLRNLLYYQHWRGEIRHNWRCRIRTKTESFSFCSNSELKHHLSQVSLFLILSSGSKLTTSRALFTFKLRRLLLEKSPPSRLTRTSEHYMPFFFKIRVKYLS